MDLPLHSYAVENASTARLVNTYVEQLPQGAKGQFILRRSPGMRSTTALTGGGRGLHNFNGVLYAVAGTSLYRIDQDEAATEAGAIAGAGLCTFASNTSQLAVSHAGSLSVLEGSSVSTVVDTDVPNPIGPIDYLDNYLIAVHRGTGQFVCSALADFTDYDALFFATAESQPDNLLAIKSDHAAAVLFGERSMELWDNQGGSGFPFVRNFNGVIELGIAGEKAVTKQDNSLFWLANDLTLRRLNGITPQRVSQHSAERQWHTYATTSDAELSKYTLDGHLNVVVHFPSESKTWVYDATTQEMSEREGDRFQGWDVAALTECYGKTYVQRRTTGEVGVLEAQTYRQWGNTLRAEWAYQPIYKAGSRLTINSISLGISTGLGDDELVAPQISLELSKKGGRAGTFRALPSRSLGKKGEFTTRVHWERQGEMRDGVFRGSLSDAVPLTIWDTTVT